MRTFRIILAVLALVLIIHTLFDFNYNDFSWHANKSGYLIILSMTLTITGLILSNKSDPKNRNKS
jgi:hypothetical protein